MVYRLVLLIFIFSLKVSDVTLVTTTIVTTSTTIYGLTDCTAALPGINTATAEALSVDPSETSTNLVGNCANGGRRALGAST